MSPVPRLPATRCTAEDVFADTALARLDPSPSQHVCTHAAMGVPQQIQLCHWRRRSGRKYVLNVPSHSSSFTRRDNTDQARRLCSNTIRPQQNYRGSPAHER